MATVGRDEGGLGQLVPMGRRRNQIHDDVPQSAQAGRVGTARTIARVSGHSSRCTEILRILEPPPTIAPSASVRGSGQLDQSTVEDFFEHSERLRTSQFANNPHLPISPHGAYEKPRGALDSEACSLCPILSN